MQKLFGDTHLNRAINARLRHGNQITMKMYTAGTAFAVATEVSGTMMEFSISQNDLWRVDA